MSLLVPGRQCQVKIVPGSPKITYVRTMLLSRTRQPIHQTCIPLTKSCIFWDSLVGSGVEYCQKELSRLLLWCFWGNGGWFLSFKLSILLVRLKIVSWSWCIAAWYCHLGTGAGAGKAGWHASTSCFAHWSVVIKIVIRVYDFKARHWHWHFLLKPNNIGILWKQGWQLVNFDNDFPGHFRCYQF